MQLRWIMDDLEIASPHNHMKLLGWKLGNLAMLTMGFDETISCLPQKDTDISTQTFSQTQRD